MSGLQDLVALIRADTPLIVIETPDDATRVVVVTSGTGASTAFGIAEDVFAAW